MLRRPSKPMHATWRGKRGLPMRHCCPHHSRALAADPVDPDGALAAIGDPFSRLVAAGVLLRRGRATAGVIMRAVDTAAEQGWRRPLLAWLQVQQQRARALGANEEAARLQRRIDLVLGGGF
jgi:hypothetical protein